MAIPSIEESKSWQTFHSAEKARWNDLARSGKFITPVLFLLFFASLVAVAYSALVINTSGSLTQEALGRFWIIVRIIVTVLAPLAMAGVCVIFIYKAVIAFVRAFYQRPENEKLLSLIQWRAIGVPPVPPPLDLLWKYPLVTIKEPDDLKEDHWVRWLGGPAALVIYDGTALYLERGSRFARVLGPGKAPMPFLDHWETVRAVIDLRPQVKTGRMHPWTKDGIQVELEIRMECQINASEEARAASSNLVYPFDPLAVKQAVEFTAVKYDSSSKKLTESDWLDGVWGQVTGYLSAHVSRHSVDEIALSDQEGTGPNEGNLHTLELAREHIGKINQNLDKLECGAHISNLHVGLKFPAEVEKQREEFWSAQRNKLAAVSKSHAEANGIRDREEARANAERDVLNAITERLKKVGTENLTEPVLLSLTGILDSTMEEPMVRSLVAKQSLDLLEQIRKALKEKF